MPSEHVDNKQKVWSTASSTESFKLPHAGSVSRMAHKLNCFASFLRVPVAVLCAIKLNSAVAVQELKSKQYTC
jgi:hypothetical protein